jgi:hypothetical protein
MVQYGKEAMDGPSKETTLSLLLRLIRLLLVFLSTLVEVENSHRRQEPSMSGEPNVDEALLDRNPDGSVLKQGPAGSNAVPTLQKQLYGVSILGSRWEMRPRRYYAVAVGRRPGIYTSWRDAHGQVVGYPGNVHQAFRTREEAESFLSDPRNYPA